MEQQQPGARLEPAIARKTNLVMQTPDVRIVEYVLQPGEGLSWHYHSEVADTFYCLEGLIGVEIREPPGRLVLSPGEKCVVPTATVHRAGNAGDGVSRYLLIQGVGRYDFNAVG